MCFNLCFYTFLNDSGAAKWISLCFIIEHKKKKIMKRFLYLMVMALVIMTGHAQAQEGEKELTREQKKALQEQLDSLLFCEAEQAINDKMFTLEADRVVFKYGQTAYVSSNTNFVSVNGEEAVVQVAFNIPVSGPNGIGGVTVEGRVTDYKVNKDKKNNIRVSMNVMGTGISARVDISLPNGGNKASVDITPNFNSNRLSLSGTLLPIGRSNVYKGRSL